MIWLPKIPMLLAVAVRLEATDMSFDGMSRREETVQGEWKIAMPMPEMKSVA